MWEPMKPAPPVMRADVILDLGFDTELRLVGLKRFKVKSIFFDTDYTDYTVFGLLNRVAGLK